MSSSNNNDRDAKRSEDWQLKFSRHLAAGLPSASLWLSINDIGRSLIQQGWAASDVSAPTNTNLSSGLWITILSKLQIGSLMAAVL